MVISLCGYKNIKNVHLVQTVVPQACYFVSKNGNKCHFRRGCEPSHFLLCSHSCSSAPKFVVLRMLQGTSLPVPFTICYGLKQHQTSLRHQCNWELVPKTGWVPSSSMSVSAFPPWEICSLQHSFPLYLGFTSSCVPVFCATSGQKDLRWEPAGIPALIQGGKCSTVPECSGRRRSQGQHPHSKASAPLGMRTLKCIWFTSVGWVVKAR